MNTMWDEIRYKVLSSGSKLNLLIGVNILVFVVFGLLQVIETLTHSNSNYTNLVLTYLYLPAYWPNLLPRFYTPFTYIFFNEGLFGLIFNMLWFWWFGRIFEEYFKAKNLLFRL